MLKYFNRLTCKYLMYNSTRVVKRGYQTNRTFFFGNSRILKYDDKWITLIQKFKGAIAKSRITVLKISRSRLMGRLKFTNPGLFLNFTIHGPKRGWIADHGKPLHHSSQVRTLNLKVRTTLSKKSTIIQYFNNYPELEPTKKNDGPKRRNILYTLYCSMVVWRMPKSYTRGSGTDTNDGCEGDLWATGYSKSFKIHLRVPSTVCPKCTLGFTDSVSIYATALSHCHIAKVKLLERVCGSFNMDKKVS